ncbi:hypothetical protein ACTJ7R_29225 (plasmid) [Escherichia coli]|uniref:hypothetical protein n=1 Tax=Escherichia coli TaxID=562 RepID=UPI003F918B43
MMINGQKLRNGSTSRQLVALYRYQPSLPLMFCSAKHLPGSRIRLLSLCRNRVARHLFRLVTVPEIILTSIMIMLFIIMYPGARAIIVANKIQQVMAVSEYIKINWATATSRFPWLADYFVLTETAFYEVTGKGVWTVVPKGFRLEVKKLSPVNTQIIFCILSMKPPVSVIELSVLSPVLLPDRITASYCCHSLHAQAAISTIHTINWPSAPW